MGRNRDRVNALPLLYSEYASLQPYLARGVAVLTPNRRLARAVLAAHDAAQAESGARAWPTPSVMPLSQWIEAQWRAAVMAGALAPREVLDVPRQRRLWREVIEALGEGFSLLSPAVAAQRCQEARRNLLLWQVDCADPATVQQFSFGADSALYLRWHAEFERRCAAQSVLCAEDAATELLGLGDRLADEHLLLLDSDALPPLHRALVERAGECATLDTGAPSAHLDAVTAFADERSELQAIARWCRERVEVQPDARIGVVLQDMGAAREALEFFLRREFDCLTRRYESLPVNFATGLTLDRVPLVRDGLRLLALAGSQVSEADFRAVLQSRFVARIDVAPAALAEALEELAELGASELPQRVLLAVLEKLGEEGAPLPWDRAAATGRHGRWQQRARLPSAWIEPFRAQLDAWGWLRGAPLDSLEHQQAEHWLTALESLARYDAGSGELSLPQAVALLRDICAQTLFQPRTDDAAIQVLGPLETTGLHFDTLWLAGMSARHWPGPARPNPYLPYALQRARGMPDADTGWTRARAAERWARWLRSADELRASYVALEDGAAVAPSPLLPLDALTQGGAALPDVRWIDQAADTAATAVTLADLPLRDDESAASAVGAAALQQMAACPFQAFAAQRLDAEPSGEGEHWLDASERGSVLHDALYLLHGELPTREALSECTPGQLDDMLDRAIRNGFNRLPPLRRELIGPLPLELERERLRTLLGEWLALERERAQDYEVVAREQTYELQLDRLTLRLRTDREDRLAGGERVILDYKSGRPESPAHWFSQPPQRPQLPLYALLDPRADAIAYAVVRPGECALNGVGDGVELDGIAADIAKASKREDLGSMAAARDFWARELTGLASEFCDGDARVEPRHKDACNYCQRFSLCRLGEVET